MSSKHKRRNRQHGAQPVQGGATVQAPAAEAPREGAAQAAAAEPAVDFAAVKTRLAEIAEAVSDESLPLDEALDLYEEAVALGLQASDLLETGIAVPADDELVASETGENEDAHDASDATAEAPADAPVEE